MTISEARQALLLQLQKLYDQRESTAIADWVMEAVTGWSRIDRIVKKSTPLETSQLERLKNITRQLLEHKPVQYILGEAWFRGLKLYVDENVLIPRPETEELVEWAIKEVHRYLTSGSKSMLDLKLLDVGTGSGCIPISLKKTLPQTAVYACDISEGALSLAKKNAAQQEVNIEFKKLDFLKEEDRMLLPVFDVIVSNPPYIAEKEKEEIDKHVIEYEPHLALFVPEENPLIFYEQLARFGKTHLQQNGFMLMEIHSAKGQKVKQLFNKNGYEVELRKDMHGNERMIRASHSPT